MDTAETAQSGQDNTTSLALEPPPLREAVLSGRFLGSRRAEEARQIADFVVEDAGQALRRWFGPAFAAELLLNADAMRGALDRDIAAIDALMSEQVDAILHAPRLRKLEGSWRGLAWLVGGLEPGGRVKVRLLTISWPEICRDLERAAEFDQSHLFRQIYEGEFGMPGGEPFGLLLIDHEVRHRPSAEAPTDDVDGDRQVVLDCRGGLRDPGSRRVTVLARCGRVRRSRDGIRSGVATPATVARPLAEPGRTRGHAVRLRGHATRIGSAALAG